MQQSTGTGQPVSDTGALPIPAQAPTGPHLRVTLRSNYLDHASAAFLTALDEAKCTIQPIILNHATRKERVFLFADDSCLPDIRAWGSNAVGCHLIFGFVIES